MEQDDKTKQPPKKAATGLGNSIGRLFGLRAYFKLEKRRPPIVLCFDHLYSEYLVVRSRITQSDDPSVSDFVRSLPAKKEVGTLLWSDLYQFQLILADILPHEQIRTKIRRLRFDYRSVAGEKEFDDYLASKPPDLQSPPPPAGDQTLADYERLLRDDLKDLLGRMYLEYAILPVREARLTKLTMIAAGLCLLSLLSLLGILGLLFFLPLVEVLNETPGSIFDKFDALGSSDRLSALTVFVVVVSGAMGGFVSALQRIQSPPTEGDSLYNLSLLFHGAYSVFVAPVSGAIFAIVLYLLFTSGTLTGTFFPTIFTPPGKYTNGSVESTSVHHPETEPTQSSDPSPTPDPPVAQMLKGASDLKGPATLPTPKPEPVPEQGINVVDFLARSGPGSGKDYALLIVWCFIAGFAERFVPDALDRLIGGGKKASRS